MTYFIPHNLKPVKPINQTTLNREIVTKPPKLLLLRELLTLKLFSMLLRLTLKLLLVLVELLTTLPRDSRMDKPLEMNNTPHGLKRIHGWTKLSMPSKKPSDLLVVLTRDFNHLSKWKKDSKLLLRNFRDIRTNSKQDSKSILQSFNPWCKLQPTVAPLMSSNRFLHS